ncbi:MAG: 1-acyl-sn-glycerol-3-phosphate acyltransferase, partial [Myxococcaceae bacterium]|nr:1-acyl-sn-glycerol-3-phosphate acyltransferase [Myxococcaceae bacterium]
RGLVAFALRLFYRVEVVRRSADLSGPVMFVGNHPNSLIDPALVFVITERQVTFLAREPLFRVPVMGWLLKGIDALPVYRKQDHPGLMEKNEGTLDTAAAALTGGRAITIFPEGKSHSAPQLSEIKTGCARISLKVARGGTAMRIIPIGLTYEQKHRFRSRVHIEVGEALLVGAASPATPEAEQEWVRALTERVGEALRSVTLNLEDWEDLALIETADQLFALRNGFREKDPARRRVFSKGASLLGNEQPDRFDDLKEDLMSFRARLELVNSTPGDLSLVYRPRQVASFVGRNLAALLLGFPLFALGTALFCAPYLALKLLAMVTPVSRDRVATLKLVSALVMVPAWWTLLTVAGWALAGSVGLVVALVGALPLALFTRYFLERRRAALNDALAFLRMGNRSRLKQHLLFHGERLQEEIQVLVRELKPRLD